MNYMLNLKNILNNPYNSLCYYNLHCLELIFQKLPKVQEMFQLIASMGYNKPVLVDVVEMSKRETILICWEIK